MGIRAMVWWARVASLRRARKGGMVRWMDIVEEDIVGLEVLLGERFVMLVKLVDRWAVWYDAEVERNCR